MQPTTSTDVDRYMKMDKLGEGTYGVVYKAKDRQTGEVSLSVNRADRRSQENKTREGR